MRPSRQVKLVIEATMDIDWYEEDGPPPTDEEILQLWRESGGTLLGRKHLAENCGIPVFVEVQMDEVRVTG